jgi:hypothetical protein
MKILTFSGFARHGKDSSASIAKYYFEQQNKKCVVIANGDYLKFVCEKYFGWDGVKDAHGRSLLQIKGTEEGRDSYEDVWIDVVVAFLKTFGKQFDYIIIPDVRYENEIQKLKENGWDVFSTWVNRSDFDNGLTEEQKNHRSETSLLDYHFDYMISVESKMYKLKDAVEKMIVSRGL